MTYSTVLRSAARIVALTVFLGLSTTAFAHTHLEKSVPAKDAKLTASPAQISMTFNGPVQLTAVTIESADGKKEAVTPLPEVKSKEALLNAPKLAPGAYTIVWRAVGEDGHVVAGKIEFTIAAH